MAYWNRLDGNGGVKKRPRQDDLQIHGDTFIYDIPFFFLCYNEIVKNVFFLIIMRKIPFELFKIQLSRSRIISSNAILLIWFLGLANQTSMSWGQLVAVFCRNSTKQRRLGWFDRVKTVQENHLNQQFPASFINLFVLFLKRPCSCINVK